MLVKKRAVNYLRRHFYFKKTFLFFWRNWLLTLMSVYELPPVMILSSCNLPEYRPPLKKNDFFLFFLVGGRSNMPRMSWKILTSFKLQFVWPLKVASYIFNLCKVLSLISLSKIVITIFLFICNESICFQNQNYFFAEPTTENTESLKTKSQFNNLIISNLYLGNSTSQLLWSLTMTA